MKNYNSERETNNRILRSLVQLALSGAFTELFLQIAKDVPTALGPYITILATLVVVVAQNWADELGIKYPAKQILGRPHDE